jgi:hypothetical protein
MEREVEGNFEHSKDIKELGVIFNFDCCISDVYDIVDVSIFSFQNTDDGYPKHV